MVATKPSVRAPPAKEKISASGSWKTLIKTLGTSKSDPRFAKVRDASSTDPRPPTASDLTVAVKPRADELQCVHFGECSGCLLNSDFTNAPVMQRAKAFFARENVPFAVHIGNVTAWRTHVKLAVQPMSKWGGLKVGLYRANSHEVASIPHCRVQHPLLNEAAELIRLAALDAGVKGYVGATAKHAASGELRYIQLSLDRASGKVQVVLVWNADAASDAIVTLPRLVNALRDRHPNRWHSISVNFNTLTSNQIFDYEPSKWRLLWGLPYLKTAVDRAAFFFRPQIFRQANLDAFGDMIVPFVARHIPPDSNVVELYSGIGLMGLNVAHRAASVLCSDSNEYVADVFDRGASSLPTEDAAKVAFECVDAAKSVEDGLCDEADVLLVDPPRRGLHDTVRSFLLNELAERPLPNQLRRVVYVGCGFDAVERDCRYAPLPCALFLLTVDRYCLVP